MESFSASTASPTEIENLKSVVKGMHGNVALRFDNGCVLQFPGFEVAKMLREGTLTRSALQDILLSEGFPGHRIVPHLGANPWYWTLEYISTDPQFPSHVVGQISDAGLCSVQRPTDVEHHRTCIACFQCTHAVCQ